MKTVLVALVVSLSAWLFWGIYSSQQQESVDEIFHEPITGAFGITLGKAFNSDMVKEVLSKEQHTYKNKQGKEFQGSVLHFKPLHPSDQFQQYIIKINPEGNIYSIEGNYQGDKGMTPSVCKAGVKSLAEELELKYGKPRGKDSFGLWYSFRQISDPSKSIKLYAHRCRTGAYSVIYLDDKLKK